MAGTAFEKLTAMWHSGEIDDDEFRLATKYLKEEQARTGLASPPSKQQAKRNLSGWLLKLLVGSEALAQWPGWRRRLAEFGLFMFLALAAFLIAQRTIVSLIAAAIQDDGAATTSGQIGGNQIAKATSKKGPREITSHRDQTASVSLPAAEPATAKMPRKPGVLVTWRETPVCGFPLDVAKFVNLWHAQRLDLMGDSDCHLLQEGTEVTYVETLGNLKQVVWEVGALKLAMWGRTEDFK